MSSQTEVRPEDYVNSNSRPSDLKITDVRVASLRGLPMRVAVIRIENFLPQKGSFTDNDFALLELISEQSGIAIETAWIRAHAKVVPLARRALEELTVA